MSTQMSKDVGCPHCGAAVRTQMWPGICAQENPELRTRVLDETIFDWKCPECGYSAQFVYPCLYHDKDRKFMIYVVPNGSGREFQPVDVSEKFPQLAGVKKRVVSSPAELKEKILIFEAGLDDYAVELVKYALAGVLDEKYGKKTMQGYFCYANEGENRIGFSFFPEGGSTPVLRKTSMDAYQKSLEIAKSRERPEGNSFVPVDSLTARDMLEEYRSDNEEENGKD
ncbi:MAG TPA: CpXC domain-containing protein [Caproicibacter sp.]|nr:CpXC domain-containing protein [Caproicibacter sp.]